MHAFKMVCHSNFEKIYKYLNAQFLSFEMSDVETSSVDLLIWLSKEIQIEYFSHHTFQDIYPFLQNFNAALKLLKLV